MASRLKYLVRSFGTIDGWKFYLKFKFSPSGNFYSSKYKSNMVLRPDSSDYYTFNQVFIESQYAIPLPFAPLNIIDAGANVGFSPLYFTNRFPGSTIIAIEPNDSNFESLQKNTANHPNIKLHHKGLWYRDAQLYITNLDSKVQNDYIVAETEDTTNKSSFPAISIASIIKENNWETVDLLKMDIEGAEREVFGFNFEEWLPKTRVIFIEVHDNFKKGSSKAVFAAISKYNFSFTMNNENLIFYNEDLA